MSISFDIACLDIVHIPWGWMRSIQFGLRRKRDGHRLTGQLRGVAAIEFVDNAMSGFETLDMLKRYGIPAWAGAVIGIYKDADHHGAALRLHLPASQERWARYLLARAGVMLLDRSAPPTPSIEELTSSARANGQTAISIMPRPWADSPRLRQPQAKQQPTTKPQSRQRRGWFDL